MPRERQCRKCGELHTAPTGKGCKRHQSASTETDPQTDLTTVAITQILTELRQINGRLDHLEAGREDQGLLTTPEEIPDTTAHAVHDNSSDLGTRVRARMADLNLLHHDTSDNASSEEGDSSDQKPRRAGKGKKSGRARTANDIVVTEIDWPHYHVYRGPDRRPAKYSELTVDEFVLGYLISMQSEGPATQLHMQRHLLELMRDTGDYTWESVKNFHAVLLNQFEMKRIKWTDVEAIQELRRTYAHRSTPSHTSKPSAKSDRSDTLAKSTTVRGPVYCLQFQSGECKSQGDHASSRGTVKHICSFCLKETGCMFAHAELDCRRKTTLSKNEEL